MESHYIITTVPLIDALDQQGQLEVLLDRTKPLVPADCQHLHPLLFTPFRDASQQGSRF
ncbi:hypothetical protein [Microvirga rosea]|uniref:hypothetical protein n=1 Tax=Microvirga rosea TaxID=2715425 RepID=UPI001D0B7D38|nr:hypothetical protein [Microvirga rosea]MCB8821992.1 hypothetical protein [Microvirga rosea]